jgi:mRNA-degrading endonuclease toxin of MazEF toxin-antitoxin module
MLTSGDAAELDLGAPVGRAAGLRDPAIVVTAQRILDAAPTVVHVVPPTSTARA